jgi:hypothetical protein
MPRTHAPPRTVGGGAGGQVNAVRSTCTAWQTAFLLPTRLHRHLVVLSAEIAADAMATACASTTATLSEMAKEEDEETKGEEVLTAQEFSQEHEQQPEQEQHPHRVHELQGQLGGLC